MRRTIVEPADVSATALAELKSWLGISRPNEDDLLIGLLLASLDMCEAFTGQAPLSQQIEERMPVSAGRYSLSSRPVTSFISAEVIDQTGEAVPLDPDDFEFVLQSIGSACFSLFKSVEGQAVSVILQTGLAQDWDNIPAAIKQGLIRMAAYHYRDRDRPLGSKKDAAPPASITALWRPWRSVRLQ